MYIDNAILTGTNMNEIQGLKAFLYHTLKIKYLGKLHYFIGLEILYKSDGIIISQRTFLLEILKEYKMLDQTSMASTLDPSTKLHAKEGSPMTDPTYYRKLIGKLKFLTNTTIDITYGVQQLSQFM